MNDTLVLIPARLAATRLPGKPLVDIHGIPMIVHVLRRAQAARIGEVFEFALLLWSLVYVFLALRRVYRASVLKTVLGLAALALSYVIFYALGVSVAGMYAFVRG